jgi:hypothetical protein
MDISCQISVTQSEKSERTENRTNHVPPAANPDHVQQVPDEVQRIPDEVQRVIDEVLRVSDEVQRVPDEVRGRVTGFSVRLTE